MRFEDIKKDIKDLEKIGEGWRGVIYKGKLGDNILAFKIPKSLLHRNAIKKEGSILKIVNREGIGGKLILEGDDFIAYEYIEGQPLKKVLNRENAKKIFSQLLEQARKLDLIGISKEEMHRPHSNVLVDKDLNVYLIDFERSKRTQNLQNVTQLVQYFLSEGSNYIPPFDKKALIEAAKEYKKNKTEKNFEKIKKILDL
ncbi:serine/threonine protein kinase [Persephonella sp.]